MSEDFENNELYDLFKREITGSSSEYYFSEDDLTIIYDIANERNDSYVKIEVLFYGASQYPKSDKLKVRKANYYYENGNLEGAINLLNGEHEQSVLWQLLDVKINYSSDSCDVERQFLEILYTTTEFSDEEIIQFVDVATVVLGLEWLLKYKDEISKRSPYPQTYLYELALQSDQLAMYDMAIMLLEELTMLEPFNAHFWEMLSMCYMSNGEIEQANSAIDYALAIDQNSVSALLIKARLYYHENVTDKNIELISLQILKLYPDNILAAKILITYYINISDFNNAKLVISDALLKTPYDKELIDMYLSVDNLDALNYVYNCVENYLTVYDAVKWAQEYNENGQHANALEILKAIKFEPEKVADCINEYIEQLYISKGYSLLVCQFEEMILVDVEFELSYTSILLFILSCVRETDYVRALSGAKSMLKTFVEKSSSVDFRIIDNTCKQLLKDIIEDIEKGRDVNIEKYDPFLN